jgi:hypothetical protein
MGTAASSWLQGVLQWEEGIEATGVSADYRDGGGFACFALRAVRFPTQNSSDTTFRSSYCR